MPVLFTSQQLLDQQVPHVVTMREAIPYIQECFQAMVKKGEVIGASSYGSFFQDSRRQTCASDIDWIVIFRDPYAMLYSKTWRELTCFLEQKNIHFHIPALSLDQVRIGNHTICSLLHGIRSSSLRCITGIDPLKIFEDFGSFPNTFATTLQLFGSFPRFFFEEYAHTFSENLDEATLVSLLSQAVSVWKDILSTLLVADLPHGETTVISWTAFEKSFAAEFPSKSMSLGREVAVFLAEYEETIEEYEKVRLSGGPLEGFIEDYRIWMLEWKSLIPAVALFSETAIRYYRTKVGVLPRRHSSHTLYNAYYGAELS